MPIGGNLGNHLNQGLGKLCEDIDSTGALFEHGLPGIPATVLFTQVVDAVAAVAAIPAYDPGKSTATHMWLISNSATPSDWYVIPISGTEIV